MRLRRRGRQSLKDSYPHCCAAASPKSRYRSQNASSRLLSDIRTSCASSGSEKNRAARRCSDRDSVARATPPTQEHRLGVAAERSDALQARSIGFASNGAPTTMNSAINPINFLVMIVPHLPALRGFPRLMWPNCIEDAVRATELFARLVLSGWARIVRAGLNRRAGFTPPRLSKQ